LKTAAKTYMNNIQKYKSKFATRSLIGAMDH